MASARLRVGVGGASARRFVQSDTSRLPRWHLQVRLRPTPSARARGPDERERETRGERARRVSTAGFPIASRAGTRGRADPARRARRDLRPGTWRGRPEGTPATLRSSARGRARTFAIPGGRDARRRAHASDPRARVSSSANALGVRRVRRAVLTRARAARAVVHARAPCASDTSNDNSPRSRSVRSQRLTALRSGAIASGSKTLRRPVGTFGPRVSADRRIENISSSF